MVAEEEAAAVLLVEHTREALVESEENVGSYLEQYERLISSFLAIMYNCHPGRPLGLLWWLSFLNFQLLHVSCQFCTPFSTLCFDAV